MSGRLGLGTTNTMSSESLWSRGNFWLTIPNLTTRFWYLSWTDFQKQQPFTSSIWKKRNFRVMSWAAKEEEGRRILQVLFIVNDPMIEWYAWEMPVEDSDQKAVEEWLVAHHPSFWKNLVATQKDGQTHSGNE